MPRTLCIICNVLHTVLAGEYVCNLMNSTTQWTEKDRAQVEMVETALGFSDFLPWLLYYLTNNRVGAH